MIRSTIAIIVLILLVVSKVSTASTNDTISLVINDLEGAGLKTNEIIMVSDKLRSSIVESSCYRILERSEVTRVAVTIHQFGAVFDDSSTQSVPAAVSDQQNHYLLTGRVSKAGSIIALSARIVDTKRDQIIYAKIKEYDVLFKDLISSKIPEFSKELISGIDSTLSFLTMQKEKGILFIESVPENGTILVDGIETPLKTPATIKGVNPGRYSVAVNSGSKIGSSEVKVVSGKLEKMVVKLKDGFGTLRVLSSVPGLKVTIGSLGEFVTPVQLDSIPAGIYTVQSINDGYFTSYDTVNVICQKTAEVNLTPERISYIRIEGVTDNSRIALDKVPLDINISNLYMVTPGEHTLSIEREGFFSRNFRLKAHPGDTTKHVVQYAPHPAALSIQSAPDDASIVLNNRDIGKTPCIFPSIVPGTYKLQLSHWAYEPIEMNLNLIPGAKMEITESFKNHSGDYRTWEKKKKIASISNLAFAGTGQIILGEKTPGFSLFSVGILSDLAVLGTAYQFYSYNKDYRNQSIVSNNKNDDYYRGRRIRLARLSTAIISSVLLRAGSFALTYFKNY